MSLCHNVFGDGIRTLKCCEVLGNPLQQSKAVRTLRARPLVWLNVVCLDAPLVACVWQWFFARNFRIVVPVATTAALFLTAWLIYLIDRFADSVSLPNKSEKTLREAFCLSHKNAWIGLTLAVGISGAVFVLWQVDHDVFVAGLLLAAIAMIYLTINFAFSEIWAAIPIKEIVVGCLFALGTFLPLLPHLSSATATITTWMILITVILFACLCSLNCMSIAVWERDLDRVQGKHSIATRWPDAKLFVRIFAAALAIACVIFGVAEPQLWPVAGCFAVSAIALLALEFLPVARDERTALADLVLLTPFGWLLLAAMA